MEHSFLNLIKSITTIPLEQQDKFSALVVTKVIPKGEHFINAGEFSTSMGFVKKGLFRYYYRTPKGEEYTKVFFAENSMLSSYSAIIQKRASYFSIEALEDSEIEQVDYIKWSKLLEEDSCWHPFIIAFLQKEFFKKEEREREFLLFDAEERYKSFLVRYPGLEKRVSQHLIASYLGIAPESLSRLRKKMISLT